MDESRPTPHQVDPSAPGALHVGHRRRARALGQRVLGVVLHLQHNTEVGLQRGDQRVDRPVALARHGLVLAVDQQLGRDAACGRCPVETSLVIRRSPASSGR